jgi:hypothetical protein
MTRGTHDPGHTEFSLGIVNVPNVPGLTKASISSGVGGSPIKSKVALRINVRRSAGGAGFKPLASSFARTKRSSGDLAHCVSWILGGSGMRGLWNAHQFFGSIFGTATDCGYGNPICTQRVRSAISRSDSFFPSSGIFGEPLT